MKTGFLSKAAFAATTNVEKWRERFGSRLSPGTRPPAPFLPAGSQGCGIIAEVKMGSPSRGDLMGGSDPVELAELYQRAGAEAVSVVVEEKHFGGSPELFARVKEQLNLPMLWKDFVTDPYQVRLAAALGASAVLLIIGLVPDEKVRLFMKLARELGLSALVEVHSEEELGRAVTLGAGIVGVNNRNLVSLEVDTSTSKRLASRFPAGLRTVSESGIKGPEDVRRMAALGYRAVLVGEVLVTTQDPERLLGEMVKAGQRAEGKQVSECRGKSDLKFDV